LSTESLVTALINAHPEFGGKGATVPAWDGVTAQAMDAKGHVFTFTL
jgi:hypothetical protein